MSNFLERLKVHKSINPKDTAKKEMAALKKRMAVLEDEYEEDEKPGKMQTEELEKAIDENEKKKKIKVKA